MQVRRLSSLDDKQREALLSRDIGIDAIRDDVREIIERVRTDGDDALRAFAREYDDVDRERIDVTDRAAEAAKRVDEEVMAAIETATTNVRAFHDRQRREDWRESFDGRELGRRFRPIERVGVYVPGGRAAYPSSAIMGVVPATVAGVDHVTVATPPAEELNPVTLAAIHHAGADRVYAVGGAQAIGALAYGTETVDAVEKIAGPGNRWVTAAKAAVKGDVAIDFLAGPSEILVLADESADPEFVAADMIAQGEHDPDASAVVLTDDSDLAGAVVAAIDRRLENREHPAAIRDALASERSGVFTVNSMEEAVSFAEAYAPEHLSIQAANDEALLARVDSAGSVFLGPYTPVAAGDYATGTNHVLPTGREARVTGGLSVDTFLRATTVQRLDHDALADLEGTLTTLARAEGLEAHAKSVEVRFDR